MKTTATTGPGAGGSDTMDPGIFARVFPGLSRGFVFNALEYAVEIFGKKAVFLNFIIGLGENAH